MPYLPSGESLPQTAEEIQNTLTSPQFQQVAVRAQFSFPPPLGVPWDSSCLAFLGPCHCSEQEFDL